MSRISTTKWNLFFFYLRTLISFANGVLIVPLYLKYIDNTLFGLWLASGNILTWITIVDPGVGDVLTQKISVAHSKKNYRLIENILSSSIIISIVISIIAFLVGYFLSFYINEILNISSRININELLFAFKINLAATCLTLFSFCLSGTILGLQKTKEIGFILTITGILGIILNVILLFNDFGLSSIAYSSLFKSIINLFIYVFFLYNLFKTINIKYHFNLRFFKAYTKLFSYTFSSKLFGTLANNLDLVIISRFLGPNSVTMLEITRRPIKIIQSFINIPSQSLLPALSNLYGENDKEKLAKHIKRFITAFTLTLFIFISGFIVFNKELIGYWVDNSFYIGDLNNFLLCLSIFTATFSYNLSNLTYCMGNIKGNSMLESFKNMLYIILLFILIKLFGIYGALLSLLLTSITTEFWYYPLKTIEIAKIKSYDILIIRKTIVTGLLISIFLILIFININTTSLLQFSLKAILFTALYFLLYYKLDYSVNIEIKQLKNTLKIKYLK